MSMTTPKPRPSLPEFSLHLRYLVGGLLGLGACSWLSRQFPQTPTGLLAILAVPFYREGKELARYKVSGLIQDLSRTRHTSAGVDSPDHEDSAAPRFVEQGRAYQLTTIDGIRYRFDLTNGAIAKATQE